MIGFDTNVLLRLIVKDDPKQTMIAAKILKDCQEKGEAIYLSDVVLCEMIWTLRTGYRFGKPALRKVLESIIETVEFRFANTEGLRKAVAAFANGRGDFADYLIGVHNADAGCRHVVTFDKSLAKGKGWVGLE